jgi:hypothetical protein
VVGGDDNQDPSFLASSELWDPATATFGPTSPLAHARYGHTATRLLDGRVLVVGGDDNQDPSFLASSELWDPATATFGRSGSLGQGRAFHTATRLLDGRVLVVGGDGGHTFDDLLASAELWYP